MTSMQHTQRPEAVAAYETIDGASKAGTQLVQLGFDEQEVRIAPRE